MPASNANTLLPYKAVKAPLPVTLLLGISSLVLVFVTYRSTFDPKTGKPVCERRVLNTYLYVFTMIAMLGFFTAAFLPLIAAPKNQSLGLLVTLILIELAAFLFVVFLNAKYVLWKHLFLALWIVLGGYFYALLVTYTESSILLYALLITFFLFGIMTWFAYQYESVLLDKHRTILYILIIIGLVTYILSSFFLSPQSTFLYVLAIVLVVLITASIAYKAKALKNKECDPVANPPDYPRDSLSILVDLRVIFDLLIQIFQRNGRGSRRLR